MIKKILFLMIFCFFLVVPVYAAYIPDDSKVLVFADFSGGVVSDISDKAKVPLFCLYRDGKLLYQYITGSSVTLMETKLSEDEIADTMSYFKGYQEWNSEYEGSPFKEMPLFSLKVFIDNEMRTFSVRGIDYSIKQKLIPHSLVALYRHMSLYHSSNAVPYKSDEIFLYVKPVSAAFSSLTTIVKWRSRVNLALLSEELSVGGIASSKFSGKQANSVIRALRGVTPYHLPLSNVIFRQKDVLYQLGYRPLLPHELK